MLTLCTRRARLRQIWWIRSPGLSKGTCRSLPCGTQHTVPSTDAKHVCSSGNRVAAASLWADGSRASLTQHCPNPNGGISHAGQSPVPHGLCGHALGSHHRVSIVTQLSRIMSFGSHPTLGGSTRVGRIMSFGSHPPTLGGSTRGGRITECSTVRDVEDTFSSCMVSRVSRQQLD